MAHFAITKIKSFGALNKLRRELEEEPEQKWVFRGQQKAKWPLKTSLDRACEDFRGNLDKAERVEAAILREFQRRLHHYESTVPKRKDYLEWWSVMQHHGAPTRLLDFSYSFFVGFYFAIENATNISKDDPAVIWAVNVKRIKHECASMAPFTTDRRCAKWLQERFRNERDPGAFARVFLKNGCARFVCHASPFRLNPRLTVQRGMFMVPGSVHHTFDGNLRAIPGHRSKHAVLKILLRFDKNERRKALHELNDMGVNRATLFPGLDGFAESLAVHQPTVVHPD